MEEASIRIRTILVPTDFSSDAARALADAIGLAKAYGARLELLHACEVPADFLSLAGVAFGDTLWQELRRAAQQRLESLRREAEQAGVPAGAHVRLPPAAQAILASARELGADLVVMGARGHGGLKELLLGSVAERTLRESPCPVLTVSAAERPRRMSAAENRA